MLAGKTALITGGATGIGRSIALRLAKDGVNVVINYSRSKEDALNTQKDAEQLGVQAMIYQADVSSDEQVRQMVKETVNTFGRLDMEPGVQEI